MQEKELITKIIAQDKKAIKYFYQKHYACLLNFVLRKIDKQEDAEEIVQDVLMDALDSMPFFKGNSSLFSWVCGIAKHNMADFYRKQKIKRIVFSKLPWLKKIADEALSPEFAYEKKQLQKRFFKVLSALPEGFSQILRLKYIDSLSVSEIAENLEISYKAAESKLFRARVAFREEYTNDESSSQKNKQVFQFTRLS